MNLPGALASLCLISLVQPIHAENLDLTKGLGPFTWAMSYAEAVKIANTTYGEANVHKLHGEISRLPGQFTGLIGLPRQSTGRFTGLIDQVSSIDITHGDVDLALQFFHDRLYLIAKSVELPIEGYLTSDDFNRAALANRLKSEITAGKSIEVRTNFEEEGLNAFNGVTAFGGGRLSFSAVNNGVFNEEISRLRANKPDLDALFLAPLLKP